MLSSENKIIGREDFGPKVMEHIDFHDFSRFWEIRSFSKYFRSRLVCIVCIAPVYYGLDH